MVRNAGREADFLSRDFPSYSQGIALSKQHGDEASCSGKHLEVLLFSW